MAWTYSGNPSISMTDLVHYRLGDIDPANPIATDEECLQALADNGGNSWLAAACLAENHAAQLLRQPTMVRSGDRMTQYGNPAEWWLQFARTLRLNASLRTTTTYAGGIDQGEKESQRHDQSLVQPFARKDLHTHPRRPGPTWDPERWE
jgi:hypothetical protein